MSVYIDTSALLAVLDADDDNHKAASRMWKRLLESNERLICSSYVLVESCALVQRRLGMKALKVFLQDITPLLEILWVDEVIHMSASEVMMASGRKSLSIVDCVSFALIRRNGIERYFAFDRHFSEQGFNSAEED
ncbi:MAG: PIN domain-containing protein [Candidatus Eremiobacteraeota bacterium]|nr:PIN domain-containing protein [Candidatus Eremiobacteraeota bacterium]